MKPLLLAMLLSVVQAAQPVPRQTIKDHSEKAGTKTQIPKDSQQSTATLPLDAAIDESIKEDSAAKSAHNKAQDKDEGARKYEPWNRADKLSLVYDLLTGSLVVIGGLGVRFTLRTLRAIERNTEAFVHSQRPIITCDPHKDSGAGWHPILDIIDNGRMRLDLLNRGQTSAFRCRQEMWIELVPHAQHASFSTLEDFTFTDNSVHFAPVHPFSIYPNHKPVVINIPVGRNWSPAEHSAMKAAQLLVYVRLRITYRDVFLSPSDPDRFSDFGYWVMFEGLGPLSKYQDSN